MTANKSEIIMIISLCVCLVRWMYGAFPRAVRAFIKPQKCFQLQITMERVKKVQRKATISSAAGKNATEKSFHIIHSFSLLFEGARSLLIVHCQEWKMFFLIISIFFLFIFLLSLHSSAPSWVLPFFPCTFRAQANEIYVRHCLSSVPFLSFLLILLIPN